jgi:hypothetical protein
LETKGVALKGLLPKPTSMAMPNALDQDLGQQALKDATIFNVLDVERVRLLANQRRLESPLHHMRFSEVRLPSEN